MHDAFHDALTELPNRALFLDRLTHTIERCRRDANNTYVVLFLDIDRFKVVNDSLGHLVGDQLLIAVARRLKSVIRRPDTVARFGGDEFVILLEDNPAHADGIMAAERIQSELLKPFHIVKRDVTITVSIGIVSDTRAYTHPNDVLRDADIAMYQAKALGKDRYEVFDTCMRTQLIARLEFENELRGALENNELHLEYQPVKSLPGDQLVGFEALLRWESPRLGKIEPSDFIPVAEETGLIIPIGNWVLREACRQAQEWQQRYPMDPPLTISVNISGIQLATAHLFSKVKQALTESGLDPCVLKLEITESVLMSNADHARGVLGRLRELGVQVMIDDFGTGYSSLAYLKNFPIDTIKIDRSFVAELCDPKKGNGQGSQCEIVKTIVSLAHDLGMEAVAEGIETSEQKAQLEEMDCHYGQGYLLARPMVAGAVEDLLGQVRTAERMPEEENLAA